MENMKNRAKSNMLKELSKTMSDDQNSPLKDVLGKKMQKVTVMSDSKKGLEKGLSKAEEILKKKESMMPSDYSDKDEEEYEEDMEDSKEEDSEYGEDMEMKDHAKDDMSKDQIEEMIAMLQKKLEKSY